MSGRAPSSPQHLDDHPLFALTVPFAVEDSLPGAKIELAGGDRHDDLVAYRQAAQMGRGVVLPRLVVAGGLRGPPGGGFPPPTPDVLPPPPLAVRHPQPPPVGRPPGPHRR